METEVMEQNKLIAEFDGKEKVHPNDLKYHTSWDWQQPAYQKVCKAFKELIDTDFNKKSYFHHRLFDIYPSHYRHREPDKAAFILAEAIQYLNSHSNTHQHG